MYCDIDFSTYEGSLEDVLFEYGSHHELYSILDRFFSNRMRSEEALVRIISTVLDEFQPMRLAPKVNLLNLVDVDDSFEDVRYDEVLNELTRDIRYCRLALSGPARREQVVYKLVECSVRSTCCRALRLLIELRYYDNNMPFNCNTFSAYHLFDEMWGIIRPVIARLDELISVVEFPEKYASVAVCYAHPSSHLRCYETSGTGRFHICTGQVHGARNLCECLRRYDEATAKGKITDHNCSETK